MRGRRAQDYSAWGDRARYAVPHPDVSFSELVRGALCRAALGGPALRRAALIGAAGGHGAAMMVLFRAAFMGPAFGRATLAGPTFGRSTLGRRAGRGPTAGRRRLAATVRGGDRRRGRSQTAHHHHHRDRAALRHLRHDFIPPTAAVNRAAVLVEGDPAPPSLKGFASKGRPVTGSRPEGHLFRQAAPSDRISRAGSAPLLLDRPEQHIVIEDRQAGQAEVVFVRQQDIANRRGARSRMAELLDHDHDHDHAAPRRNRRRARRPPPSPTFRSGARPST